MSHPDQALSVTNDSAGIQTLIGALHDLHPTLVVLEATGGLERAVVAELLVAQLPVAVVNPARCGALPRRWNAMLRDQAPWDEHRGKTA